MFRPILTADMWVEFARSIAKERGVTISELLGNGRGGRSEFNEGYRAYHYAIYRLVENGYGISNIARAIGTDEYAIRYALVRHRGRMENAA